MLVAEHQLNEPDVDAVREQPARPFVTTIVPAQVDLFEQCTTPLDNQAERPVRSPLWRQVEPIGPICCLERWTSSGSGRSPPWDRNMPTGLQRALSRSRTKHCG